jgi:pilus assembly protein CpaE
MDTQSRLHDVVGSDVEEVRSSPYLIAKSEVDDLGATGLTIALIGPEQERREEVALALAACSKSQVHAFASYPPSHGDTHKLLEQNYDVIVIELDSDPEYALDLVEMIGANRSKTVMVYSTESDPSLLVRCMRAGAREFLTPPFDSHVMADSLVRAEARRTIVVAPVESQESDMHGKLLPFMGAKGGTGVTTLACNFAVALAQETGQKTLLIDLDLPLGDVALNLGIVPEYSTITALQASDRLDSSFLSRLIAKHSSGLSVLASPGKFQHYQVRNEDVDRLLTVAQQSFENVVVDIGSKIDLTGSSLFKNSFTTYLVTQAGVPELRNSNRIVSQYFNDDDSARLEVVINRYEARTMSVSEADITKALTRPAHWKIPNDYALVRRMQINATPLTLADSPVSRQIHRMAQSVNGQPVAPAKKKIFSLFG